MEMPGIHLRFTEEQIKRINLARELGRSHNNKVNNARLKKTIMQHMHDGEAKITAILKQAELVTGE